MSLRRAVRSVGLSSLCLAAAAANIANAGSLWMDGEQIEKAFGGKEIVGVYANGRPFSENYLAGGRLEYLDNLRSLGGHWSVKAGTLCTIYDGDPAGGCFRVMRTAADCYEFYFVTRTEDAAPGQDSDKPKWTARGSLGDPTTACPAAVGT